MLVIFALYSFCVLCYFKFSAFLFVIFREDLFRPSSMHRSRHRYDGPIIREIDEEEEEQHRDTKRRKGVFGRLFKANDE